MNRRRLSPGAGWLIIASILLAACQPQTIVQTQVVQVTQEVQVPVVQTQVVKETQVVEVQQGAFTRPHPILSDGRVRQALAYCTNKLDLIKSVYPLLTEAEQQKLILNSFLPDWHWAYAGDDFLTRYDYAPDQGRALLDEAGWTLADGAEIRTNAAGDDLALKLTTTTAAFRQTWAAVWEQQMLDCGVQIIRLHVPATWLFGDTTGLARRDFEMAAYAYTGQPDPAGQTLYACDQIPLPENNWLGQNGSGWCNPAASDAIKLANNSLLREERVPAYRTVQEQYTQDVPAIPLFNRTDTFAINAQLEGFAPAPGQQYTPWNVAEWQIPGRDTVVYGFTQEPASLFTLVESGKTAVTAASFIYGFAWTSLNYNFEPVTLKQLAALENGQSTINEVEVKEGDVVADATGNIAPLALGTSVKNSAGEVVEYTGGTLTMSQIVSRFEYREDLVWSDGTPVTQADYELKWKIDCDRESGATTFITCDQTQKVDFLPNGYVQTLVPGVQSPLYFLNLDTTSFPDIYPAHRVIESEGPYQGQKLADVPAKDWATLAEIAEQPLGVGPYVVAEWVKGEKIVLEANPYFYGGAPKTPRIVLAMITPENAEAQLIGGQVDILDDSTLVGVTEALKGASDEGLIKIIIDPSATWEHIDFNLFLP